MKTKQVIRANRYDCTVCGRFIPVMRAGVQKCEFCKGDPSQGRHDELTVGIR